MVPTENAALPGVTGRTCASADILAAQLAADPGLRARREILETFTANAIKNGTVNNFALNGITIPVVVNVVYHTEAENISIEQITSQKEVLNKDISNRNTAVGAV